MAESFTVDGIGCKIDFRKDGDYSISTQSKGRTVIDIYDKKTPIERAKWMFGVLLKKARKRNKL